jgi:stearoyl-CoA desaturase (delta-9 desaturase)
MSSRELPVGDFPAARDGVPANLATSESALPAPEVAAQDGDARARRLAYLTVLVPTFGMLAAVAYSLRHGFERIDAVSLAAMYLLTSFGVEGGLHRLFSHRAYRPSPALTALIGILGCMAAQGPILFWAATHRMHHAFTDQEGDPHSPRPLRPGVGGRLKGLWHAHVGWLFTVKRGQWSRYVPDLLSDRRVMWVNQHYAFWVALGLAIPATAGALIGGTDAALRALLWGGLARIFLLDQVTWAVNSLGHTIGRRPHATRDSSRNIAWLALLSAGGGWHNNHHAHPALAHNDLRFWQLDTTAWIIRILGTLGWVAEIRQQPAGPQSPIDD